MTKAPPAPHGSDARQSHGRHVQKLPGLRGPYLFDAAVVARFKAERDAERKKES